MEILLNKWTSPNGQIGEASRWRVCYQRGLPRLISTCLGSTCQYSGNKEKGLQGSAEARFFSWKVFLSRTRRMFPLTVVLPFCIHATVPTNTRVNRCEWQFWTACRGLLWPEAARYLPPLLIWAIYVCLTSRRCMYQINLFHLIISKLTSICVFWWLRPLWICLGWAVVA